MIPHPLHLFLLLHSQSSQNNYLHRLTPFPHLPLTPQPTAIWLPRLSFHRNGCFSHDFHVSKCGRPLSVLAVLDLLATWTHLATQPCRKHCIPNLLQSHLLLLASSLVTPSSAQPLSPGAAQGLVVFFLGIEGLYSIFVSQPSSSSELSRSSFHNIFKYTKEDP